MAKRIAITTGLMLLVMTAMAIIFRAHPSVLVILGLIALIVVLNAYFVVRYVIHRDDTILKLRKSILEHERLLKRKDRVEEQLVVAVPTGIMLIGEQYDIQWANDAAKAIFENTLEGKNLAMIHKPLKDTLALEDTDNGITMKIYEHWYDVRYERSARAVFFYQVTEREETKRNHYRSTTVIGVLHLDNLEDALDVFDVQERNEIQGKYLGALDDWAYDKGFYTVPLSTSKMIVFMHRHNLDNLIDSQFKIIDVIAELSKENELMITLSGGFACANIPLSELGELAEAALDLALSRGGDQIVVNMPGEPSKVFGGNTNTQEKRTRISSRINAQRLAQLFEQANHILIMPHTHPDTDALGSAIGVLKMAQALNKEASIVLDFETLDKTVRKIIQLMEYEYVALLDYLITSEEAIDLVNRDTVLVLVDHHSRGQLIDESLYRLVPNFIIIDHHRKLQDYLDGAKMSYLEPYASSSTELVVEMINVFKADVIINPFEATIMLSGIIVDTNNFMYRTGSRTFEAAALLRKFGADTYKVKNILRESLKDIQIKSQLLSLAEVIKKRFSIVVVPDTIGADRSLLAQIADDLLEIDNTVAAFTIGRLDSSTVGISARSLEGFNVQIVMEAFGGGGHLNNAGAQIEQTDIQTVKTNLVTYLEQSVQEEKPMKVILKKDLKNRGKKGEIIEVAAGYGNYLLTSKQAIEATAENLQAIEDEKDRQKEIERKEFEAMKALKQRLDYRAVKLYVKIGEKGKFYGKISAKHIADALLEQHEIEVDKRKIIMPDQLDTLGTHEVQVKLHKDVTASFELLVLEA